MSVAEVAKRIAGNFQACLDHEEKYGFIMKQAKVVPWSAADFTELDRVHGCQSTTYLSTSHEKGQAGGSHLFYLKGTSNSDFVKGLLGIFIQLYQGKPVAEVCSFPVFKWTGDIGLRDCLSLGRRNGLHAMTSKIFASATIAYGNEILTKKE